MSRHYDVAILGGGPAGSLCAALVIRQNPGRTVTILEREQFPRHHVGEVTLPGWARILRRAGVLEKLDAATAVRKAGVIFNWGPDDAGDRWTADFRETRSGRPADGSWHVDRATFDQVLLEHAQSLGATVRQRARVTAVARGAPMGVRWTEGDATHELTADHVVDATGQARLLARSWRLPTRQHADMNNYAVYGYWRSTAIAQTDWPVRGAERWAVISTCDHGWMWHIPIGPQTVSVGLVTTRETLRRVGQADLCTLYRSAALETQEVGELLHGAVYIGDRPDGGRGPEAVQVVQDWSYRVEQTAGPGWFLAGDAAMFVDPVLSSGLTLAAHGASMAANALTTLWRDPEVDAPGLRDSYHGAYRDLADAYHRMARTWYQRNLRASTWHWKARQERLRAGGMALHERDSDAFTAVCLGAIGSPLDAAVPEGSKDMWGSEFFAWITADRLFADSRIGDAVIPEAPSADDARLGARRALMERWRRLVGARVRLRSGTWSRRQGHYTNPFMDHWAPLDYVELSLERSSEDDVDKVVFPTFSDLPEGLLPHLDGAAPTGQLLRRLLRRHKVSSAPREARLKAAVEMVIQLEMMGLVDVTPGPTRPPLKGHPFLTFLVGSVLRSVDQDARITMELDWLGESCWLAITRGVHKNRFRLMDAQRCRPGLVHTATTAVEWARAPTPGWGERFVEKLLAHLTRLEQGRRGAQVRELWAPCADLAGTGLAFDHAPGAPPVAQRL